MSDYQNFGPLLIATAFVSVVAIMAAFLLYSIVVDTRWCRYIEDSVNKYKQHRARLKDPAYLLFMQLKKKCPDCLSKEFAEGPSGSLSTNIKCCGCGAKFNVTPMIERAERI